MALASLTYELITGSNHFFAPNLSEAEDTIFDAELVLPSLCMDDVDEAIDDILFCALEPYRDERYDTVRAFAKELQPCLGSPKEGAKKLAEVVSPFEDDEEATDIFDPLSARAADRGARAGFADSATYYDADEPQGVFGFLHLAPPGVEPEYVERSRQRRLNVFLRDAFLMQAMISLRLILLMHIRCQFGCAYGVLSMWQSLRLCRHLTSRI